MRGGGVVTVAGGLGGAQLGRRVCVCVPERCGVKVGAVFFTPVGVPWLLWKGLSVFVQVGVL